jgi:hypothetical protein
VLGLVAVIAWPGAQAAPATAAPLPAIVDDTPPTIELPEDEPAVAPPVEADAAASPATTTSATP